MDKEIQKYLVEKKEKWKKIAEAVGDHETASLDSSTSRQMSERVVNFLAALRNPTKRIGDKRVQRKANPDFVAPERIGESRFDQLDKEDRWSRTEYREGAYGDQEDGFAYITVQDPRDPDDIPSRAPTTEQTLTKRKHRVTGEEDLEVHPEKISQLRGGEEGELQDWEQSAKDKTEQPT